MALGDLTIIGDVTRTLGDLLSELDVTFLSPAALDSASNESLKVGEYAECHRLNSASQGSGFSSWLFARKLPEISAPLTFLAISSASRL